MWKGDGVWGGAFGRKGRREPYGRAEGLGGLGGSLAAVRVFTGRGHGWRDFLFGFSCV